MIILGINGVDGIFHDASASLLVDGSIVASVEEERFNRKKHSNGVPFQAIEYCLQKAGATFSEIDHIGYYLQPEILRQTFLTDIVSRFHGDPVRLANIERAAASIDGVEAGLRERFAFGAETKFHFLNHHFAHAASAYYISAFASAAVLTIDGSGDRESSVLFHGCGKDIEKVHDFLVYPESLGYLYNVFAAHLGLSWISGPGKLMGLAGYGCADPHRFRDIIQLNDDHSRPVEIDLSFFDYYLGGPGLSAKGLERFGPPVAPGATLSQWHLDLAATVQNALEQAVLHLARQIPHYLPQERNLCLSGGVALNVTTNRRIRDLEGVDGFFVSPPAYDGGTSLGCALFLDSRFSGRHTYSFDPYLGPDIEKDFDIESALRGFAGYIEWQRLSESELIEQAADCLAQDRFIGWVQGRMECGPRALGNRSILANPAGAATKDRLNAGVKKREAFRPYAPSVLQEECANWFDLEESPYMLLEAMVHPDKRDRIPAVVHVDGSSRPQTVTEAQNPRYYKLLRRFYERTGIPLVLNTSFNQHGEPVVNRPEEAITALLATELDDLFLAGYHVRRNPANSRSLEYVSIGGHGVWKQDEIPGLFDLTEVVPHDDGLVTGGDLPHVSTAPAQWSYAAAIPLHSVSPLLGGIAGKILLRIRLKVEAGRIGLLFVEDDWRTVAGEPVERGPSEQETFVDILLDPAPGSGWLVVRNCAAGGLSSACTLLDIRGFEASHGLPDPMRTLEKRVPGLFDLRQVKPHNDAEISGEGPVTILTIPAQWSYAASFRWEKGYLPDASQVRVRIDATVERGRCGFIFTTDDFKQSLGRDEERSDIEGDCTIDLVIDHPPDCGWVLIRNNAPGDVPSQCVIHRIQAYGQTAPKPDEVFGGDDDSDGNGSRTFDALRRKWVEVPLGLTGRRQSIDLIKLDDGILEALWSEAHRQATTGTGYAARGWYQELYRDVLRGKRVLDVGSGAGFDGITFARAGAKVSFLDIVPSNLDLLDRLCKIFGVEPVGFHYLQDMSSLDGLPDDFDVIWCQGSMINAPFEFSRRESQRLLKHLRVGGRWIELAYPRERWQRDGSPAFSEWGKLTDGAATPWMEWYDLPRLLERLQPAEFDVVLNFNFHNDDFNWFDLIRRK